MYFRYWVYLILSFRMNFTLQPRADERKATTILATDFFRFVFFLHSYFCTSTSTFLGSVFVFCLYREANVDVAIFYLRTHRTSYWHSLDCVIGKDEFDIIPSKNRHDAWFARMGILHFAKFFVGSSLHSFFFFFLCFYCACLSIDYIIHSQRRRAPSSSACSFSQFAKRRVREFALKLPN
jgi:hypothetical protein